MVASNQIYECYFYMFTRGNLTKCVKISIKTIDKKANVCYTQIKLENKTNILTNKTKIKTNKIKKESKWRKQSIYQNK